MKYFGPIFITICVLLLGSVITIQWSKADLIYKSTDCVEEVPRVHFHDLSSEGRHNQYALWDSEDRCWRWIMLPSTRLGLTTYEFKDGKMEELGSSESAEGHAKTVDEVDDEYCKAVKVLMALQVDDGNYLIFRKQPDLPADWNPTWTVWSPGLWNRVASTQGLTGN